MLFSQTNDGVGLPQRYYYLICFTTWKEKETQTVY